jgi:hypothetical protein
LAGKTLKQIHIAVVLKEQRPAITADCHPFFRGVIGRCWADDPTKRPSFAELNELFDDAPRAKYPEFHEVDELEGAASTLYVVISSPTMSLGGENVMQLVEALCKSRSDMVSGRTQCVN